MNRPDFPILDDHIHIDPLNGRGVEAIKDFYRAGGSHICLVNKPSWYLDVNITDGREFTAVFDRTLRVADLIRETGVIVFPILGVHPAELTILSEHMSLEDAADAMIRGLTIAAEYVREGKAIGLKSGRPHYPVDEKIFNLSQSVLMHGLTIAGELECPIQLHAETGPCSDIIDMAAKVKLSPAHIIKHYATPDTPLHPSFLGTSEGLADFCVMQKAFTMESDYMDENSRPGAVIGPKSVPRHTMKLLMDERITEDDIYKIHAETPMKVYGVEINL